MKTKSGLNSDQLKIIAMIAMTVDHLTAVIWPNYPTDWWIMLLHIIGRLAAPIFWFFIAEGYHYTRNWKNYAIGAIPARFATARILPEKPVAKSREIEPSRFSNLDKSCN